MIRILGLSSKRVSTRAPRVHPRFITCSPITLSKMLRDRKVPFRNDSSASDTPSDSDPNASVSSLAASSSGTQWDGRSIAFARLCRRRRADEVVTNPTFRRFKKYQYITLDGLLKEIKRPEDMDDALREARRQGGLLKVARRGYWHDEEKGILDPRLVPPNQDIVALRNEVRALKEELSAQTRTLNQMLYIMETQSRKTDNT